MSRRARIFAISLWLACGIFAAQSARGAVAAQSSPRAHPRRAPAQNQYERILGYDSQIEVRSDASMIVTETIRVVSMQSQIRHGIYRDFPTEYTDRLGNRYVVGFTLLGATRDGQTETTRVDDVSNGKRIYLGRSDTLVPVGEHTYTVTYTTNRQLGFFADHDELFWNVTGTGWIFPIQQASATVHFPNDIPASAVHLGGYTGPEGSTATDLTSSAASGGGFQFETTRPLSRHSGLTILLTFPKGYFAAPTTSERFRYFVEDNRAPVIALAGFTLILLYYLAAWAYAGRKPKPGAIVVQYDPPSDFSPAAIRYLVRMGFDKKAFAAAIIDMAVRGYLTIRQQAGTYTLYRTKADSSVLSPDEKTVADKLFGGDRTEIWLHNENHTTISAAIAALNRWLKTAEQKVYFVTNASYMVPALALSVLMLVAIVSSQGTQKMAMAGFICVWLSMWSIGVFALVATALHLWKAAFQGGTMAVVGSVGQALFISLFALPFLGGEVFGLWFLTRATSAAAALILAGTIVVHLLFHHLLKAPTRAGRAVLDKIQGFKMFLGAVEGDRMNRLDAGNRTPETFEKLLPYALSLDVEHAWAANFSGVLDSASTSQAAGGDGVYSFTWYSGGDWASLGAANFASSLAGSLSSAIASSATAPGSSTGGGGGGGSGGGGGGGGGGGW